MKIELVMLAVLCAGIMGQQRLDPPHVNGSHPQRATLPVQQRINAQIRLEKEGEAGKLNRQEATNEEAEFEKQEQAVRDQEKIATGLEIAQGAIEITLGAVRIAGSGATAEVIRREDAVAASKASASNRPLGLDARGRSVEPIRNDVLADDAARKAVCSQILRRSQVLADDPYTNWNAGYLTRMKRSSSFGEFIGNKTFTFLKPTPNPNGIDSYPIKVPSTDEADQLLNLLEKLLNTNNEVLRVLGLDMAPLSSQSMNPGALILRQYRERLHQQRELEHTYGQTGNIEDDVVSNLIEQGEKWKSSLGRRHYVHTLSSELTQLNRARQRFSVQ